jgi:type 1 fimbria pilin
MRSKTALITVSVTIIWILFSSPTQAVGVGIDGTLLTPPICTINNNAPIDIPFGRIGVNKVDGRNFIKGINYQIDCAPGSGNWELRIHINGTAATFDNAAVATNIPDFGIQLLLDNQPWELNTSQVVTDINNPPVLQAVPVKRANSTLAEGAFSAIATLVAEMH